LPLLTERKLAGEDVMTIETVIFSTDAFELTKIIGKITWTVFGGIPMSIGKLSGAPWHLETLKKSEKDQSRHRARCLKFYKGLCMISAELCVGSRHCGSYKEGNETAEEHRKRQADFRSEVQRLIAIEESKGKKIKKKHCVNFSSGKCRLNSQLCLDVQKCNHFCAIKNNAILIIKQKMEAGLR